MKSVPQEALNGFSSWQVVIVFVWNKSRDNYSSSDGSSVLIGLGESTYECNKLSLTSYASNCSLLTFTNASLGRFNGLHLLWDLLPYVSLCQCTSLLVLLDNTNQLFSVCDGFDPNWEQTLSYGDTFMFLLKILSPPHCK